MVVGIFVQLVLSISSFGSVKDLFDDSPSFRVKITDQKIQEMDHRMRSLFHQDKVKGQSLPKEPSGDIEAEEIYGDVNSDSS